jgi:DNA-binding SARP family transcriptional activator
VVGGFLAGKTILMGDRMLEFAVLGPMTVTAGGTPVSAPAKQRAVLAALLLRANRVVSTESIAEELWDADPPATARNTTQGYVNRLRRVLPVGRLITRAPGYLLEVHAGELDLDRFTRLYDRARLAAGRGDWQDAAGQYTDALALWRGEPLADVPAAVLRRTEVPRLRELRMQAIESRIDAELHLGRHAELIADLRQLTIDQPLREALHAQLMLALYRSGRQAEALEVFRAIDWRLRDELGISPGHELQQLHQRMLSADPALTSGPVPVADMRPASSAVPPRARPATPVNGTAAAAAEARPAGGASITAAAAATARQQPAPRQLPAVTPHFVGRGAELETLTALLSTVPSTAPIAAISGPPGVGKTTLALQWAHQAADQFPDGQLYVNLRGFDASGTPVTAQAAIRGFLDALQVPAERIPAGLPAQAALYRTLMAGRRVLVVLDNARDAAQVRPLLPGTAGCLTVVTSRSRLPGLIAAQGARPVSLKPLSHGEAADLLGRSIGAERVADSEEAAHELIGWCARLPLAISVAAARAAIRPGVPLAALAAELQDAKTRLDLLDTRDAASSVRTVYSWSCEQLSPPAARMFRLLGLHPGPDISLPAAASIAGLPLPEARSVLEELVLSSLLNEDRPGRYSFHDLLHLYAAEQAAVHEGAEGCRSIVRRLLDHYLISAHRAARFLGPHRETLRLPAAEPDIIPVPVASHGEAVTWWRTECPALVGAMVLADSYRFDVHAWQLGWCLAGFFSGQGRPHEWRSVALLGLSAAGRANDGYGKALARHSLGEACTTMGRYDDARPHYAAALGIYEKLGDHLGQARVHLELGLSYEFRERHYDVFGAASARPGQEREANARDALTHARRALDQFRAAGDHAGEAVARSAIGRSLALRGLAEEAVGHCERGVQMNHDLGDDRAEAIALISLGYALHKAGRYADAASACQRAVYLAQKSRVLRVEGIALTHLAESHRSTGNIPAARTAWEQALVILDDLRLPDADQVRARLAHYAPR